MGTCLEDGCDLSAWTLQRCYGHALIFKGVVQDAADLFDPARITEHECPQCGTRYRGWEEQRACTRTHKTKLATKRNPLYGQDRRPQTAAELELLVVW